MRFDTEHDFLNRSPTRALASLRRSTVRVQRAAIPLRDMDYQGGWINQSINQSINGLFINTTQINHKIIKVHNNVERVEYEVLSGKTVRREYEFSVLAKSTIITL